MSIFYCQDIENTVLDCMSADSLKNFSLTCKYYQKIINNRYADIFDFFKNIDNINISSFDGYGKSHEVLHKSIIFGKLSVCKYLMKHNKYNINIDAEFPFRLSVYFKHLDIAKYLLDYVKDINANFKTNGMQDFTAFNYSLKEPVNKDIIKMIVCHSQFNAEKYYPVIRHMLKYNYFEVIQSVCSSITLDETYTKDQNMLKAACRNHNSDVPKYIFNKYGCDIKKMDDLFISALNDNNLETIRWLFTLYQSKNCNMRTIRTVVSRLSQYKKEAANSVIKNILEYISINDLTNTNEPFIANFINNDNLEMSQIFVGDNANITSNIISMVKFSKMNGCMKYLLDLVSDNNTTYAQSIFDALIRNHMTEAIKYLLTKCSTVKIDYVEHIAYIKDLCKSDPDIVELLSQRDNCLKILKNDNKIVKIYLCIDI